HPVAWRPTVSGEAGLVHSTHFRPWLAALDSAPVGHPDDKGGRTATPAVAVDAQGRAHVFVRNNNGGVSLLARKEKGGRGPGPVSGERTCRGTWPPSPESRAGWSCTGPRRGGCCTGVRRRRGSARCRGRGPTPVWSRGRRVRRPRRRSVRPPSSRTRAGRCAPAAGGEARGAVRGGRAGARACRALSDRGGTTAPCRPSG